MTDPELNRLVDILLREEIGGEVPPDLSGRIAAAIRRGRRARGLGVALAAAAAVIALAAVRLSGGYPAPSATGDWSVEGGGARARGAVLVAHGPAALDLGGYARVDLASGTRVRLAGEPRSEALELVEGSVECAVEDGRFRVSTALGDVRVTGTRFLVALQRTNDNDGGADMVRDRMFVKVLVGTVVLLIGGREYPLAEGQEQGVEGGTFRGVVAEVGKDAFVALGEGGKRMTFHPRWIGGMPADGGGFDEDMLREIHQLMAGDRVAVEWKWEERPRALEIEVLEQAPRKGTFAGEVAEKGDNWFRVAGEGGKSMRFMPRWIGGMPADGGGLEKPVLEAIGRLRVGQKVRVQWEWEERPRAVEIRVVE